ncbi:MAG TPA: 3-oxoacyl-ACP synthase [Oceanicaulis sp.]|uniref:Beta-ketoacyl-[acyl-carrier-protein] synthase III n=1 Tax=Glycocaulis albus TaxID=1382801 RepID=A0ABQ1XFC2_9PROT|nr:beta-ketoacyl-ACP synthase III [Glycocaulis albus]GGG92959.1 3-oxoacyl-[acyl-carrier-protein] synthase 3 [Glycocaulis albus]HCY54610.1 3-oxoacyl-ACP synthase [Oceanicaulis sp.]
MTAIRSRIAGIGTYLPEHVMLNADMARFVETSDEWIRERTGISQRHIAADGEFTSDLATHASRAALAHAGMDAGEIDLIVLATATPDLTFPATATMVQEKLGIRQGAAFDIQAVCSGFLYALATADNFIKTGQAKNALVIGAETFSRILDWTDRTTCVLFGDGAGAMVLSSATEGEGLIKTHLRSDGQYCDLLYVDGGPSRTKTVGHLRMQGNQVFRHAVGKIAGSMEELSALAGIPISDIDWFVPHQANQRILEGVAKRLSIPVEKVISTVGQHGNTSAASIPLAFDTAVKDGRIKRGDLVLMEALGGGFTWGAALARY